MSNVTIDYPAPGTIRFTGGGDFDAMNAAENWCRENGISYGPSQVMAPQGLLRGDYCISKWRNMEKREQLALHGVMNAQRDSPCFICMRWPVVEHEGEQWHLRSVGQAIAGRAECGLSSFTRFVGDDVCEPVTVTAWIPVDDLPAADWRPDKVAAFA